MYKSIIPGLVSFDTGLNSINGFVMCQDLNFYTSTKSKHKFHYKVSLQSDIDIPEKYFFKSEYSQFHGSDCFYARKIYGWSPKLKVGLEDNSFVFNKQYSYLPLKIGGIFTIGENLSNLIEFNLFLNDYLILRGISFKYRGKVIGICAPGFNGKSTILKKYLALGASYIAEDYLVINLKTYEVFPTCPLVQEYYWRNRRIGHSLGNLLKTSEILEGPVKLDSLYLITNSLENKVEEIKSWGDFVSLNSLYFLDNYLVRAIVFKNSLAKKLSNKINNVINLNINYKFISINNFNYDFIDNEFN